MNYTDNPRKVYGKVEIVYSDAAVSKEIECTQSGNSEISHPNEVYWGYAVPSVRACTMDGNSTMDGSFQMMNDGCVVGWWSGQLCGADGVFANPPYIELSFVQRPIISWTIHGDEKLGQYPVAFTLDCKRNGTIVKTLTVTNNQSVKLNVEPKVDDITEIRLTVQKWSHPNACAKILQFYESLFEVYEGDAMQMFEVNEEQSAADGNYNINSDTMTVTLHNTDRKFDKGYLRSLVVLDRKITPSIGIENENGEIEYTPLGTFYSDEWQMSQDSQWVKCMGVDKLLRMQARTYIGYPLADNVSLYEIAEHILVQSGLRPSEFVISESLKDIVVGKAYLPKTTTWDALQELANAGLCRVYKDRLDRTIIRSEEETAVKSTVAITPSNMFSYVSNISLTEFANSIKVEYCEIGIEDTLVDAAEIELALDPKEQKTVEVDYTADIAYAAAVSDNANIRIRAFTTGVNACSITLENIADNIQLGKIVVSGNAINITTKSITKRDERSVEDYGVVEYTHPTSELVQSIEHAEYIATTLLEKMQAGKGVITQTWRGNPVLELGSKYESYDRFNDKSELVCEYNKITYDGGLKQETRGRKI